MQFANLHIEAKLWFRSNCFYLDGLDLKSKCQRYYNQSALLYWAHFLKNAITILPKQMLISEYFLIFLSIILHAKPGMKYWQHFT